MKPSFYGIGAANNPILPDENEIRRILSDLFDTLDEDACKQLLDRMTARIYHSGEIIYGEGEMPRHMLCLISGKVKTYKEGIGHRQIMRIMRPVSYFGYRAALAEENYISHASAFEESLVIKFPINLIKQYLLTNVRLANFLLQQTAMGLGNMSNLLINLTQKHLRARLADGLLYLHDCYSTLDDGHTLACKISREDLANLCNMNTNNAIRTLSQFASEGVVTLIKRTIRIESFEALRRISEIG